MNIRLRMLLVSMVLVLAACVNKVESDQVTVEVKEVLQVQDYTYLLVKAKKSEYWIAAPRMNANPGERYSYQGGMSMHDFYSKELDRTFDEVIFVEGLFAGEESGQAQAPVGMTPGSMAKQEKANVVIGHAEGSTPISQLYADPAAYEGKVVRITGEVTKFNPAIMDRNWVHIQDGTDFEGKFDLTATSDETFEVGDLISIEGVLATNIDFGYGYSYEILLEKATAVK